MVQPKTPPISFRLGTARLADVDAWATAHGLSRHAGVLALIDLGLGKGRETEPVVPTPAPRPAPTAAVRQSFSHGRSKTVVVEAKRRAEVIPAKFQPVSALTGEVIEPKPFASNFKAGKPSPKR